jgi:UDP-2-acetamido-2,6-beta-L-arabino-hexul-4-ose reductase
MVFSSSIQAVRDNPYGQSKREAEAVLENFAAATGARVVIHRFSNLFGKWSQPNYNTVTATFCHNIARDLPIQISDPSYRFDLSYVDDVVEALLAEIGSAGGPGGCTIAPPVISHNVSLGELAALIRSFKEQRASLLLPDFGKSFVRKLYATYLSFLPEDQFAYNLLKREDERGSLAEFIKTEGTGQIFVSRTHPGVTRGNHYHHTKVEKFLVVEGEGIVRFRSIQPDEPAPLRLQITPSPSVPGAQPLDPSPSHLPPVALASAAGSPLPASHSPLLEYRVRGDDYRVVDIPPGYTHSIENTGKGEMVTLFWASEVFDPAKPDTYFETVL